MQHFRHIEVPMTILNVKANSMFINLNGFTNLSDFDEDEDPVSVRTDEELQTFLVESLRYTDQNPLQIQLSESPKH